MEKKRLPNWLTRSANSASLAARGFIERQIPFFPVRWIEKIQQHRLRSIIRHAYETVPFYRQAMNYRGLNPRDLRTVEDMNVAVEIVEHIPRTSQGKFQKLISEPVSQS